MGTSADSPAPTSPISNNTSWWRGILAGPVAGVCSRLVTYPTDTVKARLQVQGAISAGLKYRNTWDAVQQILRTEGTSGFYKGFTAVALGSVPANLAYFTGYEVGKTLVPAQGGMLGDMAVGAIAQLVGGVVFTPVDIIKERMQVQAIMGGLFRYTGPWHALQALVQDQGAQGLFRGYWATNAVWLPWNVLYIAFYEQSKRMMADASTTPELAPWVVGMCSAGSASVAGLLTHPADVVKTRLQVLTASAASGQHTAVSIARDMLRQEGTRAFFTGATARLLTLAPGTALSWMIYEPVKRLLCGSEAS